MQITVIVKGNKADAYCDGNVTITSGMKGTQCKFMFSKDWDEYPTKTAKFKANGVTAEVPITDSNIVDIPSTLLTTPRIDLGVGVVGENKAEHKVLPSTMATIGLIRVGVTV